MDEQVLTVAEPRFGTPSAKHPFYHMVVTLGPNRTADTRVLGARLDGRPLRDIWLFNDGQPSAGATAHAGSEAAVVVRADWRNDTEHTLELDLEDADGRRSVATCRGRAPQSGGYWNPDWPYYSATLLTETEGLPRSAEPVHLLLAVYADRISDPAREVRVVAVDGENGQAVEVPSQVSGVSVQPQTIDEGALPTTTFEVAFLADVPAHASRVYLVFYGNAQAAPPAYPTDLTVSGSGLDLTIENSHYRVTLHPKSGQLDTILVKQGVDALWEHKVESNGALHWNPDVFAPPRIWSHASDWDPPANVHTESGPVYFSIQRWGPLPDYPDVLCSVTYTFYANQPWFRLESVTDVLEDLDVRALRNGEIVVNLAIVREYAWKAPDGRVRTVALEGRPQEPRRALDIPARSPWWAFFNRERQAALAAITLDASAYRRGGGLPRTEPYITLKWGPWAYCVRPLAYSYNSHNPQRLVRVPASSTFSERMAFLPVRLGATDDDRFAPVEEVHARLAAPLNVGGPEMEVGPLTPPEWGVTFPAPAE